MSNGDVNQDYNDMEGCKSLHTDIELLGLPLDMALSILGDKPSKIEYTRSVKNASDSGTPRVVRVKDGVITAAYFNDMLKKDIV